MKVSLLKLSEMTIFRKADFNIQEGGGGGWTMGIPALEIQSLKQQDINESLA